MWANKDVRLDHNVFFTGDLNRQIAIDELGGDALKDLLEYMDMVSGGAMTGEIQELKDLMSNQPINHRRVQLKARFRNCYTTGAGND